ncbi:MAG TPA: ABC transporter substrate-binding protein [Symbiobacteriaceae bacterium]|nr:ABC transporter substrate-binding protein [Symbiobacteriaceae bacterium]
MHKRLVVAALAFLLLSGCATKPAAAPAASETAPKASALAPAAQAWPRQVKDAEGQVIEIKAKPVRIHTLSVGYDEITMALVGPERFAAVGSVTTNPLYSNIAEQAKQVAQKVGRKSEDVMAAKPDLVVASPFANKDLVKQLKEAGIKVVVSNLQDSIEGHADNIRLLAHLYGEEEKGEALIKAVSERLARLESVVGKKPEGQRLRVISLSDKLNTPGKNTTLGGIIIRAGGTNAAAEAGLEGWQQITLEKVVELKPDVILVGSPEPGKPDFGTELLGHPSLQNVPAIKNKRVYAMPVRLTSTLSHWNVRGAEELAKLLYPEEFKDVTFTDFR